MALSSTAFDSTICFPGQSNLSQRFGNETLNYYGGNPLNRLSFLRNKTSFLQTALTHANFIVLKDLNALCASNPSHLALLSFSDVESTVGTAYDVEEDDLVAAYNSSANLDEEPLLLFLGVDEEYSVEKERGIGVIESKFRFKNYEGRPYFAIDITKPKVNQKLQAEIELIGKGGFQRKPQLVPKEAAILAQARSLIDWNLRNQFCSSCGSRTISVHAGTKRVCPPTDRAGIGSLGEVRRQERPPCISRDGIHNIAFPRTDPTVITTIVNTFGTHVLLGRKARWPSGLFSALAGFCEPGESIEDAVRREAWEESGVRVGRVVVHSSQPWPFPSSLMIGCIGETLPGGENIHLGHDPELDDARWIPIKGLKKQLQKNSLSLNDPAPTEYQEGGIYLPPPTTIAHQLLLAVANGYHLPVHRQQGQEELGAGSE